MRNADKNRDPERARKRAVSDARCALRKLELLKRLEGIGAEWVDLPSDTIDAWVKDLMCALGVEVKS